MKVDLSTFKQGNTVRSAGFSGNLAENFCKNKILLRSLSYSGAKPALVTAGATVALSTIVRPLAIINTPNADKKDKQLACAKSIASSAVGFGLTVAIFSPIERAFDKIEAMPKKFLKQSSIENLGGDIFDLTAGKPFKFIKQSAKLSPELLSVVPKSVLTCALIVPIASALFGSCKNEHSKNKKNDESINNSQVSFKSVGTMISDSIAVGFSKILNNAKIQRVAKKFEDSNFPQHIMSTKDAIATACFGIATTFNPKLKQENKAPLVYNAVLSTGLTIAGGYATNAVIEKPLARFEEKFIQVNKNDKNLSKYLDGLKIVKPIIILGSLYYLLVPTLSTFLADKFARKNDSEKSS